MKEWYEKNKEIIGDIIGIIALASFFWWALKWK